MNTIKDSRGYDVVISDLVCVFCKDGRTCVGVLCEIDSYLTISTISGMIMNRSKFSLSSKLLLINFDTIACDEDRSMYIYESRRIINDIIDDNERCELINFKENRSEYIEFISSMPFLKMDISRSKEAINSAIRVINDAFCHSILNNEGSIFIKVSPSDDTKSTYTMRIW